jgi:hypothetical protein
MKRNAALILFLLLGLAVAFVGCDSEETDPADQDLVGTWDAASARVIVSGFSVPVYEAGDEGTLAVTFEADGSFAFVAEGPIVIDSSLPGVPTTQVLADGEGITISGTYSFTAGDGAVTLAPTRVDDEPITDVPATAVPVTFEDSDTVVLTVENTDEGRALLGFLLGGRVPQEIIDAIDGGEITFERN